MSSGSCLGPTLFIFYINDLFRHIGDDINIMIFADDCFLYKSDVCCNDILRCLQNGLNNYVDWGKDNESMVSLVLRQYMRGENGTEFSGFFSVLLIRIGKQTVKIIEK